MSFSFGRCTPCCTKMRLLLTGGGKGDIICRTRIFFLTVHFFLRAKERKEDKENCLLQQQPRISSSFSSPLFHPLLQLSTLHGPFSLLIWEEKKRRRENERWVTIFFPSSFLLLLSGGEVQHNLGRGGLKKNFPHQQWVRRRRNSSFFLRPNLLSQSPNPGNKKKKFVVGPKETKCHTLVVA